MKELFKTFLAVAAPSLYKKLQLGKYDKLSWSNLLESDAEAEILLLQFLLNEQSVFLDVGSNVGAYLYMAEKYASPRNIHGFEPIPALYRRLCRIFPEHRLYALALSNRNAISKFKIPVIKGSSLLPRGTLNTEYKEADENRSTIFTVNTARIDDFVKKEGIQRLDLIKIDVEGHEVDTIEGGEESLKKYRPVLIVEIEQRHHTKNLDEIIAYIAQMGYSCFYVDPLSLTLKSTPSNASSLQKIEHHKVSRLYVNNFIFMPSNEELAQRVSSINTTIKKSL